MRNLSRLLVLAALAALALPAMASAAPSRKRGIVVQRDARGGAVVLAMHSGNAHAGQAREAQPPRDGVARAGQRHRVSVVGHSHTAKLRGMVVRRGRHSYALAGNGSVLAVTSATPPLPASRSRPPSR